MTEKQILIEMLSGKSIDTSADVEYLADYLLKNGVTVPPVKVGDTIYEIPSADVAPVRHGRWVKEKTDVLIHWHCSACEECFFLDKPNSEYCPHCGAKMDEEDT